jgi:TfoX/Sxy family transcriptional regulator of competence genes
MAYDEELADRIRKKLAPLSNIEEKQMMGGLTFMYNDKMCVGIFRGELMCRIDPDLQETVVTKMGCKEMEFNGRLMRGYMLISDEGIRSAKDFDYWINLALDFNKKAKSSKKPAKKTLAKKTPAEKQPAKKQPAKKAPPKKKTAKKKK